MAELPGLTADRTETTAVTVFGGYDHNPAIREGQWYDECGLSSELYPVFSVRRRMAYTDTYLERPNGLLYKDGLCFVDGTHVVYNGVNVEGISVTDGEKRLVGMGAYVCVFPDGVYFNTRELGDCGRMGVRNEAATAVLTPCRSDGTALADVATGSAAPAEPADGAYWLDLSGGTEVLRVWSASAGYWQEVVSCHMRLSAEGIGRGLSAGDGVTLTGAGALDGAAVLTDAADDAIIVPGVSGAAAAVGPVCVERRVPLLDHVCEADNRLWGCRYGMTDGAFVNEIYCCKQGDFRNWFCYAGLSTDSFAVSLGSDGPFTGCAHFGGSVVFFKEKCIHKVYGSIPAEFALTTQGAHGVMEGCSGSLQAVGEYLYYKARDGVYRYDGSAQPTCQSDELGSGQYREAVGGVNGNSYMLCMRHETDGWQLWAFDTRKRIWHRPAELRVKAFVSSPGECYMLGAERGRLIALNGTEGTLEPAVDWQCESGLIGYADTERRYVGRIELRLRMEPDAWLELFLEYDSDGIWRYQGHIGAAGTGIFGIPVLPQRCDHFRVRLKGRGNVWMYAMVKTMEGGGSL